MGVTYTQKNYTIGCTLAAFCSGLPAATTEQETEVEDGATAGSTEQTIAIGTATPIQRAYYMQPTPAPGTDFGWPAGDWTVRINITTADMDTDWEDTWICRVNSSCVSQAEIGNLQDQAVNLGSTGVKTMTVAGSAQTPSANDSFVVVLGFSTSAHGGSGGGITPDQDLDTPLVVPAGSAGGVVHRLPGVQRYPDPSAIQRFLRKHFDHKHLRSRYA